MKMQEVIAKLDVEKARHIVPVSGGKDSAALAIYIHENYPKLPAEYVFCDTGCELRETYDYLRQLEKVLDAEIQFVSAFDIYGIKQKLDQDPLADQTPFDHMLKIRYGDFLPSQKARWCTRELKIRPFENFVGRDKAYSYIAIRADEDRKGYTQKKNPKVSSKPNITPVYPFKDDGKRLHDILWILEESGLGVPEYYQWRSRSGCYFCFYQQIGEWQGLSEMHPDLFEKARSYEKLGEERRYTWVEGKTLSEIEKSPRRPPPSLDELEGCAICHL